MGRMPKCPPKGSQRQVSTAESSRQESSGRQNHARKARIAATLSTHRPEAQKSRAATSASPRPPRVEFIEAVGMSRSVPVRVG